MRFTPLGVVGEPKLYRILSHIPREAPSEEPQERLASQPSELASISGWAKVGLRRVDQKKSWALQELAHLPAIISGVAFGSKLLSFAVTSCDNEGQRSSGQSGSSVRKM